MYPFPDDPLKRAKTLLWQRETGRADGEYTEPENPTINNVLVRTLTDFHGVETVLYTQIGANFLDATPEQLADSAIVSAKTADPGRDGISYLLSAKKNCVSTPKMAAYERAILAKTGTNTLEEAISTSTSTR